MSVLDIAVPEPETLELTACICPICHQRFIRREEYERHYPRCALKHLDGSFVRWSEDIGGKTHWFYGRVTHVFAPIMGTDRDLEAYEESEPYLSVTGIADTLVDAEPYICDTEVEPERVEQRTGDDVEEVIRKVYDMAADEVVREILEGRR